MDKKTTKRLVVEITPELHGEIKSMAAWRGTTYRKYIIQAVLERLKRDKDYL